MKIKLLTSMLLATIAFADDTSEAVTYLNQLRSSVGLVPYKANALLSEAAKNHALYLKEENTFGHNEENSNNSHYTGEWVWDRANHVEYSYSAIAENISMNNQDIKSSIDGLFVAIYHRIGFLSFDTEDIGVGLADSQKYGMMYIYNMGTLKPRYSSDVRALNPKVIKWPYPNYTKAQPAFFNTEFPAPLPECKSGGPSGNPISVQFNPDKSGDIAFKSFLLKDSDGNVIQSKRVTTNLKSNEFAFFPLYRLDWGSKYSAEFNYSEDGESKSEKWSFQTRSLDNSLLNADTPAKTYYVAKGSTYSLYIKPKDCNDVNYGYSYSGDISLKQIDLNTLDFKVNSSVGSEFSITLQNGSEYNFYTFTDEISDLSFSDITKDSVTLNWTHTSSGEESGYKIYRDDTLIATVDSDTKSYTDENLKPNTTYKYKVKVTSDRKPKFYSSGDYGEIDLNPNYHIPPNAYFVDIRNDWERDVFGGYAKGSVIVTYEFREEHDADEREDTSKRELNPDFVQEISDLVHGDKDAHIILICATGGRTGAYGDRSERSAAKLLSENGFRAVEHIKGGVFGDNNWQDNNLPWVSR
jgi:rhodanese-related sulfurtransferase